MRLFLATRPSREQLQAFLDGSRELPLSYSPIGLAQTTPSGYNIDEATFTIGRGPDTFNRAKTALRAWRHFELSWVEIFPPLAPVEPDSIVVVLVRHFGAWSLNGCRVVYLLEDARAFGFAYGTLTNHAERGEEIFEVSMQPDSGEVIYRIRAISKPRAWPARLGYPMARALQARFRRDSATALRRALDS